MKKNDSAFPKYFLSLAIFLLLFLAAIRSEAQQKPLLTADDYGQWESLGFQLKLSPDGKWLAYPISRVNDSNELRILDIKNNSTRAVLFGSGPAFSNDSRWLAYSVDISSKEKESLRKQNKPIRNKVELLNLVTGDTSVFQAVSRFSFSPDGKFLALYGYPEKESKTSLLQVRDLKDNSMINFGNVSEFEWAKKDPVLAIISSAAEGGNNSVQLYYPATGRIQALNSSTSKYSGLSWADKNADLIVLRSVEDSAYSDITNTVLAWRDLNKGATKQFILDPYKTDILSGKEGISSSYKPKWSKDGSNIFIGLRPRQSAKEKPLYEIPMPKDVDYSNVEVWYSEDYRIFPEQRDEADQDKNSTMLAVWHLNNGQVVKAGTDLMENTTIIGNGEFVTETDSKPYKRKNMFDEPGGTFWCDLYLVNANTGERKKIAQDVRYLNGGSPSGKYLLWFKGKDYWTYDLKTGGLVNLTSNIKASFDNVFDDHPGEPRPNGVAGWLKDDEAVLLNSLFDVWKISPDGKKITQLTNGVADSIVYRYVNLSAPSSGFFFFRASSGADEGIDPKKPMYFSMNGYWTKKSGYASLDPKGTMKQLIYEDVKISRLAKADSTNAFLFTREDFDRSPNIFIADENLKGDKQVSKINEFQKKFAWGRSELINYSRDKTGEHLQGVLLYPAGYDASKKYPMIVYMYEKLSNQVHNYVVPSQLSPYNTTAWTQNGYFVLMPDITYEPGNPGLSALRSVVPAARTVIGRGLINPSKIGLTGHSFGGYESFFIPTQTDLFAAVAEGAGISNLMSFPGQVHWNGGIPEWSHYETGQFRMAVPPWENQEWYMTNSPLNYIQNLKTPLMMYAGTKDGTVDWHEALTFYNYARRYGKKDVVMLVYPEQNHSPGTTSAKIDYHQRILQWFGHWLKDEPEMKWMKGVSYLDYEQQLKYKKIKIPEGFHKEDHEK